MLNRFFSCMVVSVFVLGACTKIEPEEQSSESVSDVSSTSSTLSILAMDSDAGCLNGPTEQFGRYLGDWDIRDWQVSQDGKVWTEQAGARWNFVCVGDGLAVQDFWFPNAGGVGTNLRTYNPDTKTWNIAWMAKSLPGMSEITAQEDAQGNIVMHYVSPIQNPPRRITFFPPTETGWDWMLEMSFDGEKTWTQVYKIKATRH